MRLKTWAALAAAALTLPFLHGCGNDDANKGYVRSVNATTEYTALDLYAEDSSSNTSQLTSDTGASAASAYVGLDKGSYTFEVKSGSAAAYAASVAGTVSKGDHYAVVTYITGSTVNAKFLSEDEDTPSSGNAKLRIFNAATSEAASVDVYLSSNACDALTVADAPLASAVTGLQTAYSTVTTGTAGSTWNVCVFSAGDTSTLLLDISSLTLKNQEIATLILTHTSGGVLLNGAVLDQQGAMTSYTSQISRIRVAADAASAGQVSVTLNSVALTSLATSPSINDYQTIASGTLTGSVTIDGVTVSGLSYTATAGTDYTLLVTGTSGSPVLTLIADNNTPSTSTSSTVKARVINGVNGSSGTLSATIDNKSLGNAALGAASGYVQIPATTGTSTVQASITTNPTSLVNQTFTASGVYTVFVWGDSTAPKLAITQDR
ncbi:MAG TPA: DUF4397 domain-containing protein [Burkholderiaceae bacterium]|nr:DUF4397 domain-containing protein [Burkholderiaceae bacterium]